jgi:hypothetical protein
MRIFAHFLLNQVTGESEFRPAAAHFSSILSVENRGVVFWDDYLMADRAYALALCRAIAPYRKWWTTQTTMRVAFDEELMAVAARA